MAQVVILARGLTRLAVNGPRRPVWLELEVPLDGVHAALHVAFLLTQLAPLLAPVLAVTLARGSPAPGLGG